MNIEHLEGEDESTDDELEAVEAPGVVPEGEEGSFAAAADAAAVVAFHDTRAVVAVVGEYVVAAAE